MEAPGRPVARGARGCVDFRYIDDALTPAEALDALRRNRAGRGARGVLAEGYPAYTTSAGWLGYADDKVDERAREAVAAGFTHLKLKVGADLEDDLPPRAHRSGTRRPGRQADRARREPGVGGRARRWSRCERSPISIRLDRRADEPGRRPRPRARSAPPLRRCGSPTGSACRIGSFSSRCCRLGAMEVCQLDVAGSRRERGARGAAAGREFGVPVCPHAGGVGLCEYVQHVSMFDYVAVSRTRRGASPNTSTAARALRRSGPGRTRPLPGPPRPARASSSSPSRSPPTPSPTARPGVRRR